MTSAPPLARPVPSATHWLVPSLADIIFAALLLWLILFTIQSDGTMGLLLDSNAGYHIRTGDYILEHGFPKGDIFSFTKPGEPWFAWEWLCAVLFSLIHSAAGMKGLIVATGAVIAASTVILLRHMVWRGANVLVAIFTLHLVVGASSIHYLARPHVFTFLFFAIALWLIDADLRQPSWRIWCLVPITLVWVNIHGGFLALLASLGAVAVGSALEGRWTTARRYAALGVACTAASGVNPYGFGVHAHAIRFLKEKWIVDLVQEYQSPNFASTESRYFEVMLFAGIALSTWMLKERRFVPALLILAWGHAALTSVRHIPIFAIALAPLLAGEATLLWDRWAPRAPRGSVLAILHSLATDHISGLRRMSLWSPALALCLWLFGFGWNWPDDFPAGRYPARMASRHADLISGSRLFTTDAWADYLTYRFYPRQRIFVDGRCDFFGREMSEQYVQILRGQIGWDALIKRYDLNAAMVPSQSALASLLRVSPEWTPVEDDGQAALYLRVRR